MRNFGFPVQIKIAKENTTGVQRAEISTQEKLIGPLDNQTEQREIAFSLKMEIVV